MQNMNWIKLRYMLTLMGKIIDEIYVSAHVLFLFSFLSLRNALRRGYCNASVVPSVCACVRACVRHAFTL